MYTISSLLFQQYVIEKKIYSQQSIEWVCLISDAMNDWCLMSCCSSRFVQLADEPPALTNGNQNVELTSPKDSCQTIVTRFSDQIEVGYLLK